MCRFVLIGKPKGQKIHLTNASGLAVLGELRAGLSLRILLVAEEPGHGRGDL